MKSEDQFKNRLNANDLSRTAHQKAEEQLKSEGILDPLLRFDLDPKAKYEASLVYRQTLSSRVMKIMKEPSGPRPVISYPSTKPSYFSETKKYFKPAMSDLDD